MSKICTGSNVAAFFDFDNTLLPGQASELRFFRYLWRQGLVGWREVYTSVFELARHLTGASLQPLRERKLYLRGKRPGDIEPLVAYCGNPEHSLKLVDGVPVGLHQDGGR